MNAMLTDMLEFARSGRAPVNKAPVAMRSLIASVVDELTAAGPGRVEVVVGDLPDAAGDASLLRQVWINLLSNAIKFSSKTAHPRIEIGAKAGRSEIEYFVRDNGCGFDAKYAGKLFGMFQRLHASRDFEGNGVGLAIVQRIVARHGGRVWATPNPDAGATFGFSLPT